MNAAGTVPPKSPTKNADPAGKDPRPLRTGTAAGSAQKGARQRRVEATRIALIHAATEVIGDVGYEKASIARITSRAKVSQGTFYGYFKSRQDLFDHLLPEAGREMIEVIADGVHGARSLLDVEERGLRSLFTFLTEHPGFYRLLNEAETLAPKAHRAHLRNMVKAYMHSLEIAQANGELPEYDDREIEVLTYMLMGIRSYLILGFARKGRKITNLPPWVTATYLRFIGAALGGSR